LQSKLRADSSGGELSCVALDQPLSVGRFTTLTPRSSSTPPDGATWQAAQREGYTMRRIGSFVLSTAALVLLGTAVAQAEHELVGFTSSTMNGLVGVLEFTLARDIKSPKS
jgi:hypothetical protein